MKSRTLVLLFITLAALCLCLFAAGFLAGYLAGSASSSDASRAASVETNATGQSVKIPVVPATPASPSENSTNGGNATGTTNATGASGQAEKKQAALVTQPEPGPAPTPPPEKTDSGKEKKTAEKEPAFAVQTGAFLFKNNAEKMADQLAGNGYNATIFRHEAGGKTWFFVRFGSFDSLDKAIAQARAYRAGQQESAVVAKIGTSQVFKAGEATPVYLVQVGDFSEGSAASVRAASLTKQGSKACTVKVYGKGGKIEHLVVLGAFKTRKKAAAEGQAYAVNTGGTFYVRPLAAELWKKHGVCPK